MAQQAPDLSRAIQSEYQGYLNRFTGPGGLMSQVLTVGSPLYKSMNPDDPEFACTRDSFYLSLMQILRRDEEAISIARFRKCAESAEEGGIAIRDGIDSAIHAYSILIRNLYNKQKFAELRKVVMILQDPNEMRNSQEEPDKMSYKRNKDQVLLLIGDDLLALSASPRPIKTEVFDLVAYLFRNENRYIRSSELAKNVIYKFVLEYNIAGRPFDYQNLSPLGKAHFLLYILQNRLPSINISQDLDLELMIPDSRLNQLLVEDPNSEAFRVAQEIREEIRDEEVRRRSEALETRMREGSGGSKKRTLINIKSKSRKTYKSKNKMQKKKSHRRHHHDRRRRHY
jgi:hypothetical protein